MELFKEITRCRVIRHLQYILFFVTRQTACYSWQERVCTSVLLSRRKFKVPRHLSLALYISFLSELRIHEAYSSAGTLPASSFYLLGHLQTWTRKYLSHTAL